MSQTKFVAIATRCLVLVICFSAAWHATALQAQTADSVPELKKKIGDLLAQTRYTEAVPLLERLVLAEPDNAEASYDLGSALLGQAANTKDLAARKTIRIRARNAFERSKELGIGQPNVGAMIASLPLDGADGPDFSPNFEANALMGEAEGLFSQGKLDEALSAYQKALVLDPKLYHAALFSGDVFMQKEDFAQAEVWYQKAIAIDPDRETAYRYSATPLMKQQKFTEARDRYIEAFIVEPYNSFARAGLVQWGQATNTNLAHPAIAIPTNVTFDEKGDAKINLDASALTGSDGSFAWISYGGTRSIWRKEKFAKTFPNEKTYRHSLAEEAEALRSVLSGATANAKDMTLNSSLAKPKKLDDQGLLEAYLLLARPDAGIAKDYPAYLKAHRDKLRRYVVEYVVTGGGQ
jgi:tetratricopeptide (TPR) repeat protein